MTQNFDLIVIGGGSGGLAAARAAAALGRRVALLEPLALGGTCVNAGCIPKKLMWFAADTMQSVTWAHDFGIDIGQVRFDWQALVSERNGFVRKLNQLWERTFAEAGVTHIRAAGHFVSADTVAAGKELLHAPHIIIATGGHPRIPDVPGAELGMTSDDFFRLDQRPSKVAVVGGGYIGVELSGVLHSLGCSTTLFCKYSRLLVHFDSMLGTVLKSNLEAQGLTVHVDVKIAALRKEPAGLTLVTTDGKELSGFDHVIWAVGRQPNTHALGLEAAGVEMDENGFIPTNALQDTNVEGIHAVGDVTGRLPLTPVAIAAARALITRLYGNNPESRADYEDIPSVIFSHPPIGSVGISEDQARQEAAGRKVTIYETQFTPLRYALSGHEGQRSAMKLVCLGEEERVVGIHLIGAGADEMLQGFAVALKMGACKRDLDAVIAIHPTSAEEVVTMRQPVRN